MGILGKTTLVRNPEGLGITSKKDRERVEAADGRLDGELNTVNKHQRKPKIEFCPNARVIDKAYINAYITLGNDCPADWGSGYGGIGGTECATIDLCAGAGSSLRTWEGTPPRKKMLGQDNVIGRIFASDASRIYISQQTDIDRNFGLPTTHGTDTSGHAAIGIKSDHVRVIGRNSVRLYAGKGVWKGTGFSGEKNARGKDAGKAGKIEFIAGDVENLQPIVKGSNMQKCIGNIYDHITRINQALLLYDQAILALQGGLLAHFHPSTPVVDFPDPTLAGQIIGQIPGEISTTVNNAIETMNVELDKANYLGIAPELLDPWGGGGLRKLREIASVKGKTFILSKNVFST